MAEYKGLDGLPGTPLEVNFDPKEGGEGKPGVVLISCPPARGYRVVNIYVDEDGKLVVQYSDVAVT